MSWSFRMVLVGACVACYVQQSTADAQSLMTVDHIRETHSRWCKSIQSLSYSGQLVGRTADTPPGVLRTSDRHFRAMGDSRLVTVKHKNPKYEGIDPNETWTCVRQGEMAVFWVVNRFCVQSRRFASLSENPTLDPTVNDFYLHCTSWSPSISDSADISGDSNPSRSGGDAVLNMLDKPNLIIKPATEQVAEHNCVVLVFQDAQYYEIMWLDVERAFALVQRHISWKGDNRHYVVENRDYREVAPATWLPLRVSRVLHRGSHPGKIANGDADIDTSATLTVSRIEVNTLTNRDFEIVYPPGTIIHDHDTGKVATLPGGVDMLDDVVEVAARTIAAPNAGSDANASLLWLVSTVLVLVCIGVLIARNRP